METKKQIVENWLPRYTGVDIDQYGEYILLTNFTDYVEIFAQHFGVEVQGRDRPMCSATADNASPVPASVAT